jgi:hypothetical protein
MHLPLLKAFVAVISASVLAIGAALVPAAGGTRHASGSRATSLETNGLQFLAQLAAGEVKPDAALKYGWTDDVSAVAHSVGLSDAALVGQFSAGRSLAQIAASRGVPASTPTKVLIRHVRDDLDRGERDQAISPAGAAALRNLITSGLAKS